ncbi:MAG: AMP-binding protein, partial [Rhodoferax sp.]|nr:AMP-binding protein [Rhodoferax sp.]
MTLAHLLVRQATVRPDVAAVFHGTASWATHGQWAARCAGLAQRLHAAGLQPGDRLVLFLRNHPRTLELMWGAWWAGLVVVPVNAKLHPAEVAWIVDNAQARWAFTSADVAPDPIAGLERQIEVESADADALLAPLDDWRTALPVERGPDDLAWLFYTSGTTGRPKGVMLTHRNVYINAYNFIAHLRASHEDVELWTLPMFHANGWGGPFAITAMGGTHVVLRAVVGSEIYRLIEEEKVTFACMAPAVLSTILNYPDKAKHKITTKPRFTVAGAPPPAAFIERLEQELGWEFLQIYGLTETAPLITVSTPDFQNPDGTDYPRRARAGVEVIGCDIQVLDENGQPVPMDGVAIGEVCARGNMVLKGYWEQQEETDRAIYDGYFHSGDLAVMHPDGYLQIK